VHTGRPQEKITLKIDRKELDKISSMKLDLLLPQSQPQKRKHRRVYQTEPLLVCELPVKVHRIIPIKEATVTVNLITVHLNLKK